jgi:hypothetical protein
MRADHVEISWDVGESKWLVRIEAGEEVIRRHCEAPKDADDRGLHSLAQEVAQEEGYELDPAQIRIRR